MDSASKMLVVDKLGLGSVHHIGIVSADRDRTIAEYQKLFGVDQAYTVEAPVTAKLATGIKTFPLGLGFLWLGNCLIEIIQPRDDSSPHADYLREIGPGINHFAFLVPSIAEVLDKLGGEVSLLADGTIEANPLK